MAVMRGRLHLKTLSSVQIEWELGVTSSAAGQSDFGWFGPPWIAAGTITAQKV